MKDTEQLFEAVGETAEYAKQYAQLQMDFIRLETAERVAKVGSTLIAALVIASLGMLVVLMLTLAAAVSLGQYWGSYTKGFLCLAGFYSFLAVLVLIFRERWLTNPILTSMIQSFFK